MSAARYRYPLMLLAGLALLVTSACGNAPFELNASGPFSDPTSLYPSMDRVAILVTVANQSGDDLDVNPGDFVARDADRRVYASNPTATASDAGAVSGQIGRLGALPLPSITLRGDDTISGFVVFDLPSGIQPVEVIWRQSDSDTIAHLAANP